MFVTKPIEAPSLIGILLPIFLDTFIITLSSLAFCFEYSLIFTIQKNETETIKKLNDSLDKVIRLNSKFWGNKFDKQKIEFLKDGDKLSNHEYFKNTYYLKLSSRVKPELVDKDINRILDLNELYDGCYGRVSMTLYPFKIKEVFGITCELNNIQKLKDTD